MEHEKTTVPNMPAATGMEQPLSVESIRSITDPVENCNDKTEELFQKLRQMQDPDYLHTVTLGELYDSVYLGSPPIVEGLLWPGTYLFVGAPKVGKSFMMAQLAYHVSTGQTLWNYPVHNGTVLYLALEDDYRRLQSRLYRMFGTEGTENLHFAVCAKHMDEGLEGQLQKFIQQHPDTKLIIIDTLQKVREVGQDRYSYAGDYTLIARLKEFAGTHKLCLLLVHHTRKQQAEDKFDMISGTNGLLGAADGVFLMQKLNRSEPMASISISGRDQQDQVLILKRDAQTLCWNLERAECENWTVPPDPVLEQLQELLRSCTEKIWRGSPSQLASCLDMGLSSVGLTKRLNVNADRLQHDYHIRYAWSRTHEGRIITLEQISEKA